MKVEEKLALLGGRKTIKNDLALYNSIGVEELNAAKEVVNSGVLSGFVGGWEDAFYGGKKVIEFEEACKVFFGVKHVISVNSWTSGLIAAIGAIGIEPGDEVIVPPFTMCASATAILHWNAIPVFADINQETFNIDPISIEKNISEYTKAIMVVDIFGQSADMDPIIKIAKKYKLKIISDSAQSPGAKYKNKYASTMADIGGFSLNFHKHIHTGEGGILVTNDDTLAKKLQLIRNHAEAVVSGMNLKDISNMIGYNFRLGEIEASIGIEQLKKLKKLIKGRQDVADKLNKGLEGLTGLNLPKISKGCSHVYYIYPMILNIKKLGIPRSLIVKALEAEGVTQLISGYVNLHLFPVFQKKIAYGSKGFPWSSDICKREVSYKKGICPIAEKLYDESFLGFEMTINELKEKDINLIISAFRKVWNQIPNLKKTINNKNY